MSSAVFDENSDRRLCPDESCIGVLDDELVCPECGALGEIGEISEPGDAAASLREPSEVDLLYRALCPDGSCIGILGADGSCRECGRVGLAVTRDPRLRGLLDEAVADGEPDSVDGDEQSEQSSSEGARPTEDASNSSLGDDDEPSEFADRRLCYDGGCIGVIGDKGTCNECGLVA